MTALAVSLLGCPEDAPETKRATARKPKPIEDASVDPSAACGKFDDDYRELFKACGTDADCELVDLQVNCRGTHAVYAVSSADREAFDRCAPTPDSFVGCTASPQPTRAEDGRIAAEDLRNVHARCIAGACQARVEERICGSTDLVCGAEQLCVSFQNNEGFIQFMCAENPCAGQRLDCECAQPVCFVEEQQRACGIDMIVDSDVYCKTERF